jgi:hypothetical protein
LANFIIKYIVHHSKRETYNPVLEEIMWSLKSMVNIRQGNRFKQSKIEILFWSGPKKVFTLLSFWRINFLSNEMVVANKTENVLEKSAKSLQLQTFPCTFKTVDHCRHWLSSLCSRFLCSLSYFLWAALRLHS